MHTLGQTRVAGHLRQYSALERWGTDRQNQVLIRLCFSTRGSFGAIALGCEKTAPGHTANQHLATANITLGLPTGADRLLKQS